MKKLLALICLLAVCRGSVVNAETNTYKLDIQNKEAVWASGAAADYTVDGETWNYLRLETISAVPSTAFTTDPSVGLKQSDGTGDPNDVVFSITGDVTGGQFGMQGSSDMTNLRIDYLFIGTAGFVSPAVTSYDWSVTGLEADAKYVLKFHSILIGSRAGGFEVNGEDFVLNQGVTDTLVAVVSTDSNGAFVGKAYSTTGEFNWAGLEISKAEFPVITIQPGSQGAIAGNDITFNIEAINPLESDLTYQWFHDPNVVVEGDHYALTDDAGHIGATTNELTVMAIDEDDEGAYYCEVSNTVSVQSDSASLTLGRLMYHWPLDGNADEIVSGTFNGSLVDNVLWADGITDVPEDQAADFDGTASYINCGNVPVMASGQMSISFWAKPRNISLAWKGMISKWSNGYEGSSNTFWIGQHSGYGTLNYSTYLPGESRNTPAGVLENDTWTHFVCMYDGKAQKTYANGELVASATFNAPLPVLDGDLLFGQVPAGNNWFDGLIDDVRVFNYALSSVEAAEMYVAVVTDAIVCAEKPQYDLNDDCKVDLQDFSIIAASWYDCNRVPASFCD
ncbi:MAG: immunoglobulin domain-containing protein [Phycisphaerae bacterium]|nr:immunoglobulin domain-containing protein [Phycisphaerae bacterium]